MIRESHGHSSVRAGPGQAAAEQKAIPFLDCGDPVIRVAVPG